MKKTITLLALLFTAYLQVMAQPAPGPRDIVFICDVSVKDTTEPYFEFTWEKDRFAVQYEFYRRRLDQSSSVWELLYTADTNETIYRDKAIEKGIGYEYQMVKKCERPDLTMKYVATNYCATGLGIPPLSLKQKAVLVLIDETVNPHITNELTEWQQNVQKEGWQVEKQLVPRTEEFSKQGVQNIKTIIQNAVQTNRKITTVFLVGRIAVPYSGNIRPDGHPDHHGAWSADVYYADTNGKWTDATINTDNNPNIGGQAPSREQNKNVPDDGKFDQSSLPSDIDLAVGRIDFYNLPAFFDKDKHKSMLESEIALLKRYFEKNKNFRTGAFTPSRRALIDDNFGAYGEYFAATAWNGFSTLLGAKNVSAQKWFPTLNTDDYLFAYGCGAGWYTSVGGVSNIEGFVTNKTNAVHTMMFGSYFGDWDSENNVIRGSLGSEGENLTCNWSGRPHWFYHQLSIGKTIGEIALLSINNSAAENEYIPSIIYNTSYPNGVVYAIGFRGVHNGLQGDPTLQMEQNIGGTALLPPQPPSNLNVTTASTHKHITWDKSPDGEGYLIYRTSSTLPKASYSLITTEPITELFYNDSVTDNKTYRYAVQAVKLRKSNLASYYLGSDTVMRRAPVTSVNEENSITEFSVSPNPAQTYTEIDCGFISAKATVTITNSTGETIREFVLNGSNTLRWNLDDTANNPMPSGLYFIRVKSGNETKTMGITVIR